MVRQPSLQLWGMSLPLDGGPQAGHTNIAVKCKEPWREVTPSTQMSLPILILHSQWPCVASDVQHVFMNW